MPSLTAEIEDICSRCQQPIFKPESGRPITRVGNVIMNPAIGACHAGGVIVRLNRREFDLLYLLTSRVGHVFSPDTIFTCVWGLDSDAETNIVRVTVSRLRTKLAAALGISVKDTPLKTRRQLGYTFGAHPDEPQSA